MSTTPKRIIQYGSISTLFSLKAVAPNKKKKQTKKEKKKYYGEFSEINNYADDDKADTSSAGNGIWRY